MRGRPRNPQSEYKMHPHPDNGHHLQTLFLAVGVSQKLESHIENNTWGNEGVLAKAIIPVLSKDKANFMYKIMPKSRTLRIPSQRYLPVTLSRFARISSMVPCATILPPASPPPGPISTI